MDLKEQIKTALGLNTIKLEWQSKTEDGTILVSTADVLETGSDISVLTEDGTTIELPIGTYSTEDGVSFVVEEEGIVASVSESESEEVEEEEMSKDAKVEDEDKMEEEADVQDWAGMEKRIENLEIAVSKLKEDHDKMDMGGKDEEEEMNQEVRGTTPKSVKTTEIKEFSIEELKLENIKLKEQLAKAPAESPITAEKFNTKETKLSKSKRANLSSSDRFLYDMNN